MARFKWLNQTLTVAILSLTISFTSVASGDCPASTLAVQKNHWDAFIDGFRPRIVAEVNGNALLSIRIFGVRFGTLSVMGLRSGDGIVAINSHPVAGNDPDMVEEFLSKRLAEARGKCELTVTVERKGVRKSFRAVCDEEPSRSARAQD